MNTARIRLARFNRFTWSLSFRLAFMALAVCLAAQTLAVGLRYGFSTGIPWLSDLAAWSFAALVMFAIPVATGLDGHVRIDIFRESQTSRTRLWADRLATCLLLLPMAGIVVITGFPQFVSAFTGGEASLQAGGLPGHWIVRFLPLAGFCLAVVQALASAFSATPDIDAASAASHESRK